MLIEPRPADDPVVRQLSIDQQRELAGIEGDGHVSFPLHEHIDFVVGLVDGVVVACGALQELGDGVGEVKRMYVLPAHRGRGLSRQILTAVEDMATERGLHTLRLETAPFLHAAVGLYTSTGYTEIPPFGMYEGHETSVCYEKKISGPASGADLG
jgi:GNAT superfamily N-acetyltransferase